ncbi:fungal-specific transcription factor domain-containing protein [Penicillium longicatenatum]|nr:fungal-specific transcription factor domain-containing protein [Penicillium longicatenatum]
MDPSNDHEEVSTIIDPDRPSCQGCRRRKLKCSRESPMCSQCHRMGSPCVYDAKRNKPGIKTGAVESLSRRIDILEDALQEVQARDRPVNNSTQAQGPESSRLDGVVSLLSTVCMELCKFNSQNDRTSDGIVSERMARSNHTPRASTASVRSPNDDPYDTYSTQPRKRRRVDSCGNPNIDLQMPLEDLLDASSCLPAPDLLENTVNAYFNKIQPWIPILHETRFRSRMLDPDQRPLLVVIIHAMVVAAIRFARPEAHGLSAADVEAKAKRSRSIVVLNAMDSLSVENLQALTIIAFDDIGNGNTSRAWSIVGSLTRTVEYLRLSVEDEDHHTQRLLKPLLSLPPSQKWVEEEERRRVFWTIFNLDRFCSVATGWNTSLTADDVHRRLPADGGLWHREEQVKTPFFGIWNRSEAKIGNSIAFLPTQYSNVPDSPDSPGSATQNGSPSSISRGTMQPDMSTVGAFAYCIEATESLSRVTTFFLQQKINFHDRREVSSWLTRFKELDLRLVHWKMFLPQKWRDSNISLQPTLIHMDPNLTLAHVTHNTSMILLHQRMAYPPAEWANIVRLPSACSAETCQNAAIEIQNMTAKYLSNTDESDPIANQFVFCVFVAARVLLVHWRYYGSSLPQELWYLINSLDEMARRWLGSTIHGRCLASTYADRLRDLHRHCVSAPNFSVDVLGYSTIVSNHAPSIASTTSAQSPSNCRRERTQETHNSIATDPLSSAGLVSSHPLPPWNIGHEILSPGNVHGQLSEPVAPVPMGYPNDPPADELSTISYLLLDQRFMDMDRVISLDDMMFSTNMACMNGTETNQE